MTQPERLGLILLACLFYLMIRFLVACGDSLQDIAITMDTRVTQLESDYLDLRLECQKSK